MHIPIVYHVWGLFEDDPEFPQVFHHGYFLTESAMMWKLKELNLIRKPYTSYHFSELDFEDAFQQDMTNITIH